ncbi:MAG: hypothetical protein GX234_10600 [Clostridiales bacterium]|nr:hypothetical protein [Clostridiales bacterium]
MNLSQLTLQEFTLNELLSIYEIYGTQFFPADELKPSAAIKRLYEQGTYRGFGLYHTAPDRYLAGYALFVCSPALSGALLDYYAVLPQYRNDGIGGLGLSLLQKQFTDTSGIYIESENPAYAHTDAEREIQNRRIGFYERNGAKKTGAKSRLFGVSYEILYLGCQNAFHSIPAEQHVQNVDAIYRAMFSEKHYREDVVLLPAT